MSTEQRNAYEKSRLDYIGLYEVATTAEEDGMKKRSEEIAKKMKQKGMSSDEIADFTGLSNEEIENL